MYNLNTTIFDILPPDVGKRIVLMMLLLVMLMYNMNTTILNMVHQIWVRKMIVMLMSNLITRSCPTRRRRNIWPSSTHAAAAYIRSVVSQFKLQKQNIEYFM